MAIITSVLYLVALVFSPLFAKFTRECGRKVPHAPCCSMFHAFLSVAPALDFGYRVGTSALDTSPVNDTWCNRHVPCAMQWPLCVAGIFFIVGSLVMGFATTVAVLIAGRALLGVGVAGACLVSICQAEGQCYCQREGCQNMGRGPANRSFFLPVCCLRVRACPADHPCLPGRDCAAPDAGCHEPYVPVDSHPRHLCGRPHQLGRQRHAPWLAAVPGAWR